NARRPVTEDRAPRVVAISGQGTQTALLAGSIWVQLESPGLQVPGMPHQSQEATSASGQSMSTTPQPQSHSVSPYQFALQVQPAGDVQTALFTGSMAPGQPEPSLQDPLSPQ